MHTHQQAAVQAVDPAHLNYLMANINQQLGIIDNFHANEPQDQNRRNNYSTFLNKVFKEQNSSNNETENKQLHFGDLRSYLKFPKKQMGSSNKYYG